MVNISSIMDSVISLASHSAGKNNVRLVKNVPSELPTLACDPEQITQVLLNLAINAIQSMPEGGEIALAANRQEQSLVIEVKDEGVGIPSEELDQIFDPFFTTREDGTGLGLSVAHQIVVQHGGTLKARRNPDKGMTFSVVLPRSYQEAP